LIPVPKEFVLSPGLSRLVGVTIVQQVPPTAQDSFFAHWPVAVADSARQGFLFAQEFASNGFMT
jgi:hypothetical protein